MNATNGEIGFPADFDGPIELTLTRTSNLIGRRSDTKFVRPDIDLDLLTSDAAVSVRHAQLDIASSDTVTVTDLGSTNGTVVGQPSGPEIDPNTSVPLSKGDSFHIGAWTKLTIVGIGWG